MNTCGSKSSISATQCPVITQLPNIQRLDKSCWLEMPKHAELWPHLSNKDSHKLKNQFMTVLDFVLDFDKDSASSEGRGRNNPTGLLIQEW